MIFGLHISSTALILGGTALAALVLLEVLIGTRRIHFKGRTHMRVHRALAWLLLAGAMGHGMLALLYFKVL